MSGIDAKPEEPGSQWVLTMSTPGFAFNPAKVNVEFGLAGAGGPFPSNPVRFGEEWLAAEHNEPIESVARNRLADRFDGFLRSVNNLASPYTAKDDQDDDLATVSGARAGEGGIWEVTFTVPGWPDEPPLVSVNVAWGPSGTIEELFVPAKENLARRLKSLATQLRDSQKELPLTSTVRVRSWTADSA